jgi:hypothetical protein
MAAQDAFQARSGLCVHSRQLTGKYLIDYYRGGAENEMDVVQTCL